MLFRNKKNKNKSELSNLEKINIENDNKNDVIWLRRIITHNVRMPMSIIRGYSDVIKQDLLSEEERKKALDAICQNIMYLDQILSVVFNDENSNETTLTKVDISEVIRRVTDYVSDISKKNNIKINLKLETPNVYINAEIIPVMRVFYQIYENAFKYLKEFSTIEIKTYLADNDVLIVYKDDGDGIDSENASNVLEEGFRGDNSNRTNGGGYGLYDVSQIVKGYNGNIEVKSSKGNGFSIYITFPIAE